MSQIQPSAYTRISLKNVLAITVKNSASGEFFTVTKPRAFFLRSASVGGMTVQGSDPSETVRLPASVGSIEAVHLAANTLVSESQIVGFLLDAA